MKIAFISPYPFNSAPSQRFRYEHYLKTLNKKNISYDYYSFYTQKGWDILYSKGNTLRKVSSIFIGFVNRVILLFSLLNYDFIFIHREITPLGPPLFEFIIAKILNKKIIFDFDDAIFLSDDINRGKILNWLKNPAKVKFICKWSYKVVVGNEYLQQWALQYNNNVLIIPTVVDTNNYHNRIKKQNTLPLTIGWTGSHSTLVYLEDIVPILTQLQEKLNFNFIIIANKDPDYNSLKYEFLKWNEKSEIEDLLKMHIGLMPLKNTKWANGKCGFKAIQYMSLGIPAIVSNVGVNSKIVDHNINGFIVNSSEEWYCYIEKLVRDINLRSEFGKKARQKIIDKYSIEATKEQFLRLFS